MTIDGRTINCVLSRSVWQGRTSFPLAEKIDVRRSDDTEQVKGMLMGKVPSCVVAILSVLEMRPQSINVALLDVRSRYFEPVTHRAAPRNRMGIESLMC